MIKALLDGKYQEIQLFHVRLAFSDDMDSVGKFQLKKIWILFATIFKILRVRISSGARTLYYPPSGPDKVPVLRDIILLNAVRWAFKHTVFHFHAGGVSEFRSKLTGALGWGFDKAYNYPALAIRTSELNPDDGTAFRAKQNVVVHNGLQDMLRSVPAPKANNVLELLFVGVLIPSKGVGVLIESCGILQDRNLPFNLKLMGRFGSVEFEREIKERIKVLGIEGQVEFLGVKSGKEKFQHFASCDIFTFPSYFESESFGLVCVEAMMFGKPIVSTNWRGIPTVVKDGKNGLLVPIKEPSAFAGKVEILAKDPELRKRMGATGRMMYEERFTVEKFRANMEQALLHSIIGI